MYTYRNILLVGELDLDALSTSVPKSYFWASQRGVLQSLAREVT